MNLQKTLSFIKKNKGRGTLTGKISAENYYWIKVFPTEFAANEVVVNVTVDTTGFTMETEYKGKITIKSNGSDAEVYVVLKTKAFPPKLDVVLKLLNYRNINRGDKKIIQIQIKNLGGGKLFGTLSTDVSWIQFDSINSEGNDVKVNVILNAEILIAGQKHKGFIYVESNGGKGIVEINIEVIEPNPILYVDINTLNFGEVKKGDSPSKIFAISNKGGGTLSGTISTSDDFIILSTKVFSGNETRVTVTLRTDNLIEDRFYTGKIEVNTQWGKAVIEVYVKILKKELPVQKIVIILRLEIR